MGRAVNWEDVPDIALLEEGVYIFRIDEVTEKETATGKLMYSAELRVLEPANFKDLPLYDNFVIGSDDDAEAALAETWQKSFGARRMKQLAKAAQVPLDQDIDNLVASLDQQQVVGHVSIQEDTDKESKYFGRKQNRIAGYYPLGSMAPKVAGAPQATTARPGPGAQRMPVAPKAATPQIATTPTKATAPGPRLAPKPVAAKATAPVAPAKPATTAKVPMLTCADCGEAVPRSEFGDHVAAHEQAS